MGAGIAQVAAAAGHETYLTDANPDMLIRARESHLKSYKTLVEKGKIMEDESRSVLARIHYAENNVALEKAGLIIEAIIEDLSAKQQLFASLETLVSDDCLLASNTSSLSMASIASACSHPERVLGIHFFNPPTLLPLVEIIPSLFTGAGMFEKGKALVESWGKITVMAKDTPGFIVNRIARPFYGEAIRLFEEGMADMATIDWVMRETGGFRMGPFELMDLIGNDINYTVTETVWKQFFYEPRYKPSITQKRMFEAGRFGRKSGRGYYDYSAGAAWPEPVKNEELARTIFMRILCMLINEAADALYLGIANREDIDLAMTKGVNYPKGLLKWADEIGIPVVTETMQNLYDEYQEDRYRPSVMLKRMAREGKQFY